MVLVPLQYKNSYKQKEDVMYPVIDKRETGISIRRIMDQHMKRLYAYYEAYRKLVA